MGSVPDQSFGMWYSNHHPLGMCVFNVNDNDNDNDNGNKTRLGWERTGNNKNSSKVGTTLCMYGWPSYIARVRINWVRLPILLVVS